MLQVAANPLAAALGPPERSHFRLVFSQAFNSLGTVIAPYIGSAIMLSGGVFAAADGVGTMRPGVRSPCAASTRRFSSSSGDRAARAVHLVFRKRIEDAAPSLASGPKTSVLAALSLALGPVRRRCDLPVRRRGSVDRQRHDQFPASAGRAERHARARRQAAQLLLGRARLSGDSRQPAADCACRLRVCSVFTVVAAVLCLMVSQRGGEVAAYAALARRAVQFDHVPGDLHAHAGAVDCASQAATSGLLCMAIVGGAVLPLDHGARCGPYGIACGVPRAAVAYAALFVFALAAARARLITGREAAAGMAH